MKGDITYYTILGVNENATNHELRKAFCKLSIELHPDTTTLNKDDAKDKFQKVLEAYEKLSNSNSRKIYDEILQENSKKLNSKNLNIKNPFIMDSRNEHLVGNRRPFSNGEIFSLFLLIIIIIVSLLLAIVIASFTGKDIESIPTWLLR